MHSPAAPTNPLIRRYDRAASGWQRGIERLGYLAAYQLMIPPDATLACVLDAGCGTGAFAGALLRAGLQPECLDLLDPSAAMLAHASTRMTAHHQPHTLLHRPLDGPPPAQRYDLILCAHLIEHFADPAEPLRLLHAMLAPGGHLALVTSRPHWCTTLVRLRWRHRALPAATVANALGAAGFTAIRRIAFTHGPPARMSHGFVATRRETE